MTLEELLRSQSRDVLESIERAAKTVDRARQQREASIDRARRAGDEADRLGVEADERNAVARHILSKIGELEDQRRALRSRLEECRKDLRDCRQGIHEIERLILEQKKIARVDSGQAERLSDHVTEVEAALQRPREARRNALDEYLHGVRNHLRNHYCHGSPDLDQGLAELMSRELLLSGETRQGPCCLNQAREGDIEKLLEDYRAGPK